MISPGLNTLRPAAALGNCAASCCNAWQDNAVKTGFGVRDDETAIARVWQGRTREAMAGTYASYLYDEGVKKLRATKGNLGVQVSREVRDGPSPPQGSGVPS